MVTLNGSTLARQRSGLERIQAWQRKGARYRAAEQDLLEIPGGIPKDPRFSQTV
jgi:hypothetical protein